MFPNRQGAPWDWPTFWDEYDAGTWEPETKAVLKRFLTGDMYDWMIDIGAWSGPVTMWALAIGAHVMALEPDPVAFAALEHNTKDAPRGHQWTRVTCYNVALASEDGKAKLANPHMGDSQSRLSDEGITVPTVSTETMLHMEPHVVIPTLIKLDIEGGEIDVIPDLLEATHRLVPIYLSWHEPWWSHDPGDRRAWFDGMTLEPVRGDGWTGFSELLVIP